MPLPYDGPPLALRALQLAPGRRHLARQNGRNQIYTYGTEAALSERYGRLR